MAALAYFYMVCSWGGYVFAINLLPCYVLVMVASVTSHAQMQTTHGIDGPVHLGLGTANVDCPRH